MKKCNKQTWDGMEHIGLLPALSRAHAITANIWTLAASPQLFGRKLLYSLAYPICHLFLQLFKGSNRLLPSLNAIARIRPADGDGWCVLHSMLLSQGYPDDDAMITAYCNSAQDECHEFLSSTVSFERCCSVQSNTMPSLLHCTGHGVKPL